MPQLQLSNAAFISVGLVPSLVPTPRPPVINSVTGVSGGVWIDADFPLEPDPLTVYDAYAVVKWSLIPGGPQIGTKLFPSLPVGPVVVSVFDGLQNNVTYYFKVYGAAITGSISGPSNEKPGSPVPSPSLSGDFRITELSDPRIIEAGDRRIID